MNAKEMREDFKARLVTLQMNCPHESSTWMDNAWAPGHIWGRVRVCDNCEKILERITPKISESYTWTNENDWQIVNLDIHSCKESAKDDE